AAHSVGVTRRSGPQPPPPTAAHTTLTLSPHRNYPRQPVGWGTFTEAPPPVVAPYVEARPADWLLLAVLRPAWAYRLELSLIVLLAAAYVWLGGELGRQDADRVIVATGFGVALVGWQGGAWGR